MPQENHDNMPGWKSRLDQLEGVPGESAANLPAAWEKLHSRLDTKKKPVRMIWFYAAAACLLLAIVTPILFVKTKRTGDEVVKKQNERPVSTAPEKTEVVPHNEVAPAIIVQAKENNTTSVKSQRHIAIQHKPSAVVINQANAEEQIAVEAPAIIEAANSPIVAEAIPAAVQPVRKLRVVHVNELGTSSQPQETWAQNNSRPDMPANALSKNSIVKMSLTNNSSDNILKIRLSPSN